MLSLACFGNASGVVLFQLDPVHELFPASDAASDFAYFSREMGIGFGSPYPRTGSQSVKGIVNGAVSLTVDSSMEFGVFRHYGKGGAFQASETRAEFEDRFDIIAVEVWGCGGSEEAEAQKRAWEWEEREAERRKTVNFDDIEQGKNLLRMAGILNETSNSGGSV